MQKWRISFLCFFVIQIIWQEAENTFVYNVLFEQLIEIISNFYHIKCYPGWRWAFILCDSSDCGFLWMQASKERRQLATWGGDVQKHGSKGHFYFEHENSHVSSLSTHILNMKFQGMLIHFTWNSQEVY